MIIFFLGLIIYLFIILILYMLRSSYVKKNKESLSNQTYIMIDKPKPKDRYIFNINMVIFYILGSLAFTVLVYMLYIKMQRLYLSTINKDIVFAFDYINANVIPLYLLTLMIYSLFFHFLLMKFCFNYYKKLKTIEKYYLNFSKTPFRFYDSWIYLDGKRSYNLLIISFIILFPILALLFNSYGYVDNDVIGINHFLDIKENKYTYDEITKVEVKYKKLDDEYSFDYLITFEDDSTLDLFNIYNHELYILRIDTMLESKKVQIIRQEIDETTLETLELEYDKKYYDMIIKIFNIKE